MMLALHIKSRWIEKFSHFYSTQDDHDRFAGDGSQKDEDHFFRHVGDEIRGDEKDAAEGQANEFTPHEPEVFAGSEEAEHYQIISIGNSGKNQHHWKDETQFRNVVFGVGENGNGVGADE